jgi:phosphate transport system permease protein
MMASLPSVVLGFLAALVIAPVIERVVPTTLCLFFTVPLAFLLAAFLWQLLPHYTALVLARLRLFFVSVALLVGVWAAWRLGPLAERWFFAGDIMMWLDGQKGTGTGAWLLMMLPLSALLTAFVVVLWGNSYLRRISSTWSRRKFALVNLIKFVLAAAVAFGVAILVSQALTAAQLDPRGTFVDTYVPRNAMIVGFVMGFAIIPIIYTISEDALSTVPEHLRSASLGSGATPWQTAVRIVIPTAMSGLFSALMIGLGRAVGETMIVLMAAGNTPVREWNLFNGFRTLSANIAVELPEAVKDSTHYRTLFLAALTLFVLTFCVNTLAELVRLRFRRRAVQL